MNLQEQAEQLDRALAAAQKAVAANLSSAQSWHDLGVLHQMRGDLADSYSALQRAVDLDPASASAHNNLGNTLVRMGDNEHAIESYQRAVEHDPNLMAAHANAAAALHILGRNAEALVHARARSRSTRRRHPPGLLPRSSRARFPATTPASRKSTSCSFANPRI